MDKTCLICGQPSGMYPLCAKHSDMIKKGFVVKCPKCGKWHKTESPCDCEKETIKQATCPICGKDTKGKEVCLTCYHEVMGKQEEIDKNQKPWELKDYFYNLDSSIYRLKDKNLVRSQILKLYAIAWLVRDLYKDPQLSDVVFDRITKIKEFQNKHNNDFKLTEEKEKAEKAQVAATSPRNRASDGHICKSKAEVEIDNILYRNGICHAYGLKVKEIPASTERTVEADWYIPLSGHDGIYIEYWGMDKQDYQDNKEEKKKLYNKYKDSVKLIEIEKNDINDVQNLEYQLFQRLRSLGWNTKY